MAAAPEFSPKPEGNSGKERQAPRVGPPALKPVDPQEYMIGGTTTPRELDKLGLPKITRARDPRSVLIDAAVGAQAAPPAGLPSTETRGANEPAVTHKPDKEHKLPLVARIAIGATLAVGGPLLALGIIRDRLNTGSTTNVGIEDATITQPAEITQEEPTAVPTPEATKNVDSLAQALQKGRIELNGSEGDWKKYFVEISPEEAKKIVDEANNKATSPAEYRELLPFDPRTSSYLSVKTAHGTSSTGIPIDVVAFNGIEAGTLTSSSSGQLSVLDAQLGSAPTSIIRTAGAEGSTTSLVIAKPKEGLNPKVAKKGLTVGAGTPIMDIESELPSVTFYNNIRAEAFLALAFKGNPDVPLTLSNFITTPGSDGLPRIAFTPQVQYQGK